MHCGSLFRGPAITARLMRSGLSTNRTSELAHDEVHRPIDVRLPLRDHSSGVLPSGGEELFAFGLNLPLGGADDLAVAGLGLFLALLCQLVRFPPRILRRGIAILLLLLLSSSTISSRL